jgi:hypothetical protein
MDPQISQICADYGDEFHEQKLLSLPSQPICENLRNLRMIPFVFVLFHDG